MARKAEIDFSTYAHQYNNTKDFDRYLLQFKFEKLKELRPKLGDALELGCAMGLMTELLIPLSTRLDVVDASDTYIRLIEQMIQKKFPQRTNDIRCFATLFQKYQPDRVYDTIILSGVLPALPNPVKFLKLISRWLKQNGIIYITSHNAYSLHRRVGKYMGLIKNVHALSERDVKLFGHRKVYDLDTMTADVKRTGLIVKKSGGIFLKPFPNSEMERLTDAMIRAFYMIGNEIDPRFSAELYVIAGIPQK